MIYKVIAMKKISNIEIIIKLSEALKLNEAQKERFINYILKETLIVKSRVRDLVEGEEISVDKALHTVLSSIPPRSIKEIINEVYTKDDFDYDEFLEKLPGWEDNVYEKKPLFNIAYIGDRNNPTIKRILSLLAKYEIKRFATDDLPKIKSHLKSQFMDVVIIANQIFSQIQLRNLQQIEPFTHFIIIGGLKKTELIDKRTTTLSVDSDPISISKAVLSAALWTRFEAVQWFITRSKISDINDINKPLLMHTELEQYSNKCKKLKSSSFKCLHQLSDIIGREIFTQGMFALFSDMPQPKCEKIGGLFPNNYLPINVLYSGNRRRFGIEGQSIFFPEITIEKLPENIRDSHINSEAEYFHKNSFESELV